MQETNYDFLSASMEEKELHREDLLAEAKRLGISVTDKINIDTLFKKVNKARQEEQSSDEDGEDAAIDLTEIDLVPQDELVLDSEVLDAEKVYLANELVRVMVVPNNPVKREWQGEYLEVSNDKLPPIRKFIQFNAPYHVPKALLAVMEEKMYTHYYSVKINGKDIRQARQIAAYSITKLDNLTPQELEGIARRQMAQKEVQ